MKKHLQEKVLELSEEIPPTLSAVLRYCPVTCGCWEVRLCYDLMWQTIAMNLPQKIEKEL
jgi:hypothetical protein